MQILGKSFQDKKFNPVINQNTGFNLSILKAKKGKLENLKFSKPTIMFSQKENWQIYIEDFKIKLNSKDTISVPINSKVNIEISNLNSIEISDKSTFVLKDESILLKTLNSFNKEFKNKSKFKITLKKDIPIGAGLGGGSSDSATLLLGLRYFYNRNPQNSKKITLTKLKEIGLKIGSDVPACIVGKSLKLSGIGEKLEKIYVPKNYKFLLIYPNKTLSTKLVFNNFDFRTKNNLNPMYFNKIKIYNSLKFASQTIEPEIKKILKILKSFDKIIAFLI